MKAAVLPAKRHSPRAQGLTPVPDPIILPSSYFDFDEVPDMETTRISSKGQVVIPKAMRTALRWSPGQELEITETKDGVLLKRRSPFPETTIDEVAGCLWRPGMKAKSVEEINRLTHKGIREAWNNDRR